MERGVKPQIAQITRISEGNVSAYGRVGIWALGWLERCFVLFLLICAICEICGFKSRN
jgi:hypothetical protein